MSKKLVFSTLFLGVILICAGYSNTFTSPFVLDDFHSFVRNPATHLDDLRIEKILDLAKTRFGIPRFIPMLTFAMDYHWGSGEIYAYHVTNLIIHTICYLICIGFVYSLSFSPVLGKAPSERWAFVAVSVGSLWALHPVQTSAVTYLVQRMASLQAMFFLGSTTGYVLARKYWIDGAKKATVFWGAMSILMAMGAFLSKENSAVLPIVLLLVEVWFFDQECLGRASRWIRTKAQTRWGLGVLIGLAILGVSLTSRIIVGFSQGYGGRHFTMPERLLTETRVVMGYVGAILMPSPRWLSLEHDVEVSTSLFTPITTFLSGCAILVLLVFAVSFRKRRPLLTFGLLWFFITLSIESTIVPLELMFDHRMYLPSVGLVLAAWDALWWGLGKVRMPFDLHQAERRKLAWSSVAIVCSFLSLMTFSRNEDWKTPLTIHADAVRKAPRNPRAHANYSVALYLAGRLDEAYQEATQAIALERENYEEHMVSAVTIVAVYMDRGNWKRAIEEGEKLLKNPPPRADLDAMPTLLFRLADCHRRMGNLPAAYGYVSKAIQLLNSSPRLSFKKRYGYQLLRSILADADLKELGVRAEVFGIPKTLEEKTAYALFSIGDWEGALHFAEAASGDPDADHLLQTIDLLRRRTAVQKRDWGFNNGHLSLSNLCQRIAYWIRLHAPDGAVMRLGQWLLEQGVRRDPQASDLRLLHGWYAYEKGQYEKAVGKARQAVELAPQSAKAWIALGFFEQAAGRAQEALTAFRQTLELYPGYPKRRVLKKLMAKLESQIPTGPDENSSTQHASLM